jgi:iron transport multicopper oxidase
MAVSASGNLSVTDYFEPYDYVALDSEDSDFGSGGIALLDKNYFNGSKIEQIGVAVGKSGKIYVVNANNLGGYKEGAGQGDGVLQTLQMPNGVWGGCGSYPLEVRDPVLALISFS